MNEKKHEILKFLEIMQTLTPKHIQILIFTYNPMSTVYSALDKLVRGKLIDFHMYGNGRGIGNKERLYFLTKQGFTLTQQNNSILDDSTKQYQEPFTIAYYEHRHKILDFWLVLQMESRKHSETYQLLFFTPEWKKIDGKSIMLELEDIKIRPDATFIIKNLETDVEALFFVEIDTGTESIKSNEYPCIQEKFDKYQKVFHQCAFQNALSRFQSFTCARMLFITNSKKRVINLLQNIEIDPMFQDVFLFSIHHEIWWHGVLYGRFAKQGCNQAVRMNSKPFNPSYE